ncbi:MAG: MBL fold metallo-hydrolase [Dermatophilus congolensis]|nr:MBL fold metallo-hydrolase [Dermatophilus congolensis]
MRLTHFGHSCLLAEIADQRILLDPGGFSAGFEQVTGLDAIVVTHQHPDHWDADRLPDLVRANPNAQLLVEAETGEILRGKGLDAVDLASGTPVALGSVTLNPVGDKHAVIHEDIPRIHNTGVVLRAEGEPSVFHPGDALDAAPGEVDVLCVPVNAPWCAMKETIEFVRRIGSETLVPIHDGLLQARGRELYMRQIANFGGGTPDAPGTRTVAWTDLADAGAVTFG